MADKPRYRVADLGFGFAVHDTAQKQEYEFRAGKDSEHKSNNALNSRRLEIFPTIEQAQAFADELNRKAG